MLYHKKADALSTHPAHIPYYRTGVLKFADWNAMQITIIFLGNICTKEQTTVLSDTHQRLAYRHIVTFLHQTILDITT